MNLKPTARPIKGAAVILAILTLLNILNFSDRYLIVAFSTAIISDLHLSNFEFGLLTGFVFLTVYIVVGLIAGSLADRTHRPRLISFGLLLWSGLTAVSGLARSFVELTAARMFIGVGEATLTPTAASLIADAYPPARRALPFGIYYWGIPVGVGGSFIFAGIAGPVVGWRGSFMLMGAIGVVLALILTLKRDIVRGTFEDPASRHGPSETPRTTWLSFAAVFMLARSRPALILTLAGACATTFIQGSTVLDLLWWVKERGFTEADAQKYTGAMFLFGGILGGVAGGIGADVARRRTTAGDLKFLAWAFLVTVPMTIAYRYVQPATPLFYGLGFAGSILFMLYFGPISSSLQEQIPSHLRGAATGVFIVLTTLSNALGSAVVGYLADLFSQSGIENPITAAIRICQIAGAISIPCFILAARRLERQQAGLAELSGSKVMQASAPEVGTA
jgi:MFS transporter, Spinster family, sphingosine-1-phosphate transporter